MKWGSNRGNIVPKVDMTHQKAKNENHPISMQFGIQPSFRGLEFESEIRFQTF